MKRQLILGIATGAPFFATAATTTIGDVKDAMIFGTNANADTGNASGKGPGFFAGADSGATPNRKRSLIEFDVASAIPAGATITGVTLTLKLGMVAGSGGSGTATNTYSPRTFNIYDVLQDWTEGPSGQTAGSTGGTSTSIGGTGQGTARSPGDVTWDYASYDPTNLSAGKWTSAGVDLHGGNVASTPSASVSFAGPYSSTGSPAYSFSSAGMTADVQAWLNGTQANFGWMIRAGMGVDSSGNPIDLETNPQSFLGFWSREGAAANSNPDLAPVLTVTYSVPEPTGLAFVGLCTCLSLRQRRRRLTRS